MSLTVLLCTDGSDVALSALARGLEVVAPADRLIVATVVELTHPTDVVGTGIAGGTMSHADAERIDEERHAEGRRVVAETARSLGLSGAEEVVLDGSAGPALCDYAAGLQASVIVLGTRGRSGFRRAVLGSVSDHVVRNAPCPVLCTG